MRRTDETVFQEQKTMTERKELGNRGEYEAVLHLLNHGYHILARNWRAGHLELDIVAEYWGEIVFVEVKTRSNEDFMPAQFAVTPHQQRNLLAATRMFLADHGLQEQPYRFDLITVVGTERPFEITHYKRVFRKPENHWPF